jgi:hypothetical protein
MAWKVKADPRFSKRVSAFFVCHGEIVMRAFRMVVTVGSCVALVACGGKPVISVAPGADASSSRWNATLGTPDALQGVVQTRGYASMSNADGGKKTQVDVSIENAVPRGQHPWVIRTGQCGGMGAEVQRASDGRSLKVDDEGKARARLSFDLSFPTSGDYMIAVLASDSNQERVLACGNFAPPINR